MIVTTTGISSSKEKDSAFRMTCSDKDLETLQSQKSGYCMVETEGSNDVKTSLDKGIEYFNNGKFYIAEETFKTIISSSKASDTTDNLEYVMASRHLAKIYRNQFKHKEAIDIYSHIIPIQKQLLGAEHNDVIVYMSELATCYVFVEDYSSAGPLYVSCYTTAVCVSIS